MRPEDVDCGEQRGVRRNLRRHLPPNIAVDDARVLEAAGVERGAQRLGPGRVGAALVPCGGEGRANLQKAAVQALGG